ncbi:transcription initiation factor IIB [Coemansia spiralis]|uniref:Transcription initiation factor IIB n=1 Tax=Coemansia spiralis TaxID=417178 RepID=A0A9W8GIB2_9FUNG|nr:transcription initiation factor IIB [Coemansia spiralis]
MTEEQQPFAISEADRQRNVILECPYCRDEVPNLVEDFVSGDYVCGNCGLVLGDRIVDTRTEWRNFADEVLDPSRVGNLANTFFEGAQLDTLISHSGDKGSGLARSLNRTRGRAIVQRQDQNLVQAYKDITTLCSANGMPTTTVDIAKAFYKRAKKEGLLHGKNNSAIVAVCIFFACRQDNAPRTFKEISALTKVNVKEIGRTFKLLKSKLDTAAGFTSSNDLIARFCSSLNLDQDTWRIAEILVDKAKGMDNVSGRSPVTIASACIYLSSHLIGSGRDLKAISEIAGVGEAAIRTSYKILYANRNDLLTPDIFTRAPKASEANLPIH